VADQLSRNVLTNAEKSYRQVKTFMRDARLAGLIDWDAIEDCTRSCVDPHDYICKSPEVLLDGIEQGLVVDLWAEQPAYVEVWVEKDALANVLQRTCAAHQVPFIRHSNRSSAPWATSMPSASRL
jgi:hypothetical protein